MRLVNPEGVELDVDALSKQAVAQGIAVAMSVQEAMHACFKARVAFYRAGAEIYFNLTQSMLAPVDKKE